MARAIRSWDFYGIHFGSPPYKHCASDTAWGNLMRRQWVSLHSSAGAGAGGIGFPPVDGPPVPVPVNVAAGASNNSRSAVTADRGRAQGSGDAYFVGLQHSTGVEVAIDYGKERCSAIGSRLGLDKRFWLVN